jgi:RecA-family ATPase/5S rRNA maturation endonuclease (ribonuclease M5)
MLERYVGNNQWKCGLNGVERVPYLLPQILRREVEKIFIVEGEKDAKNLNQFLADGGVTDCAVTTSGSANNAKLWKDFIAKYGLTKKKVFVVPDTDTTGLSFGRQVYQCFKDAGCDVVFAKLPDMPEKPDGKPRKDISDWIELKQQAGLSNESILNEWNVFCDHAKNEVLPEAVERDHDNGSNGIKTDVITKPFSEYQPEAVQWLLKDIIPLSAITIFYGKPGQGKSFLTCWLAAALTGESIIFFRNEPIPKGKMIMLNAEDNPSNTIVPRLMANNANLNYVHNVECVRRIKTDNMDYDDEISLDNPYDFQVLLDKNPDCKLIIIDPLSAYLGNISENKNAEIRSAMKKLKQIAETHGVAIVLVTHTNKGNGSDASARMMGSRGLDGAARAVWLVSEETETGIHSVSFHKSNLSESKSGFTFTIQDRKIQIEEEYHHRTADDVFAQEAEKRIIVSPGRKPKESSEAEDWLRTFLSDGRKPVGNETEPAEGTIRYEAERKNFSWRTVRRAADHLKIVKKKEMGVWFWSLPNLPELTHQPVQNDLDKLEDVQ